MRLTKLAFGAALLAALLLSACSNTADLGPEVGHGAAIASGVFGHCYDGSTPVNGITCIVYCKHGDRFLGPDVSHYEGGMTPGNGFYNCEEGALYQTPPDGHTCIVVGFLNGNEWGRSDDFTWNQPYVGNINVYKN